jgi:hypothetical protein
MERPMCKECGERPVCSRGMCKRCYTRQYRIDKKRRAQAKEAPENPPQELVEPLKTKETWEPGDELTYKAYLSPGIHIWTTDHPHNYDEDPNYLEAYDEMLIKEIEYYEQTGKVSNIYNMVEAYYHLDNVWLAKKLNTHFDDRKRTQ